MDKNTLLLRIVSICSTTSLGIVGIIAICSIFEVDILPKPKKRMAKSYLEGFELGYKAGLEDCRKRLHEILENDKDVVDADTENTEDV